MILVQMHKKLKKIPINIKKPHKKTNPLTKPTTNPQTANKILKF